MILKKKKNKVHFPKQKLFLLFIPFAITLYHSFLFDDNQGVAEEADLVRLVEDAVEDAVELAAEEAAEEAELERLPR